MANVENRPYAGTWKLNNRRVVKYTPDALVFLNGDTSLPGCPRCRGRIDIQRHVTSVGVEAGVQPGGHSATIQLSLPRVQGQQIFIDGYNILRPGLEVHVFFRGYFPVRGMFKHLPDPQLAGSTIPFPNAAGTDKLDMGKYAAYPYYPAFHGVITSVQYSYSDGFYTGSLTCASLLHFWQFANVVTTGAWLGGDQKALNNVGRTLYGHNLNNLHPHAIIYTMYRDISAAGGVEFALNEQSNLEVGSGIANRSLFQQVTLYWEKRFRTRIQSLRMYGVNGNLFNAAQQAWLGSASTRDTQRLLNSPTKNDSDTQPSGKGMFPARLSAAKALGLQGAGADFVFSPLLKEDGDAVDFSLLNLFAFTQAAGDIGLKTTQVYQSTYQTKMDVATQVTTVTGFEFYQDVDGDLVFKPPFYNLDTSTNRYYRLEDQDIISISFTEKEPTATHIIVRGQHIEGTTGFVGNTGSLNLRGHYVDYKLVAQFGWRATSPLEITTYSDPKVLFLIGVARLDLLNVGTTSAQVTIPIRPELRPGFPVYIPFCDCFYYITQLSHQFAFGGQCTTSIVLNCRRMKWHAPGKLEASSFGRTAIDLIRLNRPDLPPRPVEIFDNGIPRIVGFPNVVMALDVEKFNPNFSVVGAGIEYFANLKKGKTGADTLFSLLQRDIQNLKSFENVTEQERADGRIVTVDSTDVDTFRLRYGKNLASVLEFSIKDLRGAISDYQNVTKSIQGLETKKLKAENKKNDERSQGDAFKGARSGQKGIRELQDTEQEIDEAQSKVSQFLGESGGSGELISLIFEALQPSGNRPARGKVDGIPESDVTLAWFEQLSHLKSQYLNSSVPGHYRYYSCSHPVEEMQGQHIITWSDGQRAPRPQRGRRPQRRVNFTSPPPSPPPSSSSGPLPTLEGIVARSKEEQAALQARLDALGVTFVKARRLLKNRNSGIPEKRAKDITKDQVLNTPLSEDIANNLANVSQAAQILLERLNARADFQATGASIQVFSSWRVGHVPRPEPDTSVSQHSFGLALDLRPFGANIEKRLAKFTPVDEMSPSLQTAYQAMREEAMNMRSNGEISGFGFYEMRGSPNNQDNMPFIHIDLRTPESTTSKSKTWYGGQVCNRKNTSSNKKLNDTSPVPDSGMTAGECHRQANARREELLAGRPNHPPPLKNAPPLRPPHTPVAPAPAQPPAQIPDPPPEPKEPPSITMQESTMNVPRLVVQFKPIVSTPGAGFRPPEAELGIGPCKRGFRIAQSRRSRRGAPEVVTTDMIQTVSFTKHKADKFTQVVGTSTTAGYLTFDVTSLWKHVSLKFEEGAQSLEDPEQTPRELWEDLYTQMVLDMEGTPIPIFDNGDLVTTVFLDFPLFDDVFTFTKDNIPEGMLPLIQEQFGDLDEYNLTDASIRQVAQFPTFKPQGAQKDDGRSWQRAVVGCQNLYADKITDVINAAFVKSRDLALEPATGKTERLGVVQAAFNEIGTKGVGLEKTVGMMIETKFTNKTVKEGCIEKPIYSPVFPVSDDRGYEHYGAFRYGRGLSVEPGGTFQFLNSGTDPFRNVTAETAETFLRVLTLRKRGKISLDQTKLEGIRKARAIIEQTAIEDAQTAVGPQGGQAVLSETEKRRRDASLQDLLVVGGSLAETNPGALRELLTASGDDPNLITQESFDLSDTQFARNYANFAVNYGKNDVFRTTVSNAAFRLADLTAHLTARAGDMCVCRGSYSDIVLAAYARNNFMAVEGVDTTEQKATAFQSEEIIKSAGQHSFQQRRYRGNVLEGAQPDAKAFQNSGGAPPTAPLSAAEVSGTADDGTDGDSAGVAGPENPTTSADPNEVPEVDIPPEEELAPPPGGLTELGNNNPMVDSLSSITGLSEDQILNALNGEDPEALAQLEEVTGSSGAELQVVLAGSVADDSAEIEGDQDLPGGEG